MDEWLATNTRFFIVLEGRIPERKRKSSMNPPVSVLIDESLFLEYIGSKLQNYHGNGSHQSTRQQMKMQTTVLNQLPLINCCDAHNNGNCTHINTTIGSQKIQEKIWQFPTVRAEYGWERECNIEPILPHTRWEINKCSNS